MVRLPKASATCAAAVPAARHPEIRATADSEILIVHPHAHAATLAVDSTLHLSHIDGFDKLCQKATSADDALCIIKSLSCRDWPCGQGSMKDLKVSHISMDRIFVECTDTIGQACDLPGRGTDGILTA